MDKVLPDFPNSIYGENSIKPEKSPIIIELKQGSANARINFDGASDPYGFVRDNEWHFINIPMADFDAVAPYGWDCTAVRELFTLRMPELPTDASQDFKILVDNIFISMEKPSITNISYLKMDKSIVYPSPAKDYICIDSKMNGVDGEIYNITGRKFNSFTVQQDKF